MNAPAPILRGSRQHDLFALTTERLVYDDAVEMTLMSLAEHGPKHEHWAMAWSGGKDSTATLTLIVHLIEAGRLAPPKTLTVYYADTRQELTPLAIAAADVMARLARFPWVRLRVVTAPLDRRFLVCILGRGVPPPNNNTLRWCTRQIKIDPMAAAIEADLAGLPVTDTVLTITGVRQGESAIRDKRIEMSCSKDGAECGQGWYQQVRPDMKGVRGRLATLAPILHWRVCNVWDWLRVYAPMRAYGGWTTAMLADAYGGDEAEEANARAPAASAARWPPGTRPWRRSSRCRRGRTSPRCSACAPSIASCGSPGIACASPTARRARTERWCRTSSGRARSPCRRASTRSTGSSPSRRPATPRLTGSAGRTSTCSTPRRRLAFAS